MAYKHLNTILGTIALLLAAIISGCVTNNGDIGNLYGIWRLDKLVVDGTDIAQP